MAQAVIRLQCERDAMTPEQLRREHDDHMTMWARAMKRQVKRAEETRWNFPWTDPHFINILRRCYRHYRERQ